MSTIPLTITAFSLVMVFGAFVLLGIFVARRSEEVAMKVAGYVTAVVFGLMAVIIPFVMFQFYAFFDIHSYGAVSVYSLQDPPRVVYKAAEGRCRVDSGDVVRSPTGCWYKSSEGEQEWMEPIVISDTPIEWVLPRD